MDYLISDPHFNHRRIIQIADRPFLCEKDRRVFEESFDSKWVYPDLKTYKLSDESMEMMETEIIRQIRRFASPKNRLFILGDFCFGSRSKVAKYREKLGGYKEVHLIWGNHDNRKVGDLFDSASERLFVKLDAGQDAVLDHYAPLVWYNMHRGVVSFYGHSHGSMDRWVHENIPHTRSMDVGVDVAYKLLGEYRPFSSIEAVEILNKRSGFYPDHHMPS